MKEVTFSVPGKPVAKQRPRVGRGGHFYTPRATKEYEEAVACVAMAAGPSKRPWFDKCELTVAVAHSRANADLDNILKSIGDALNGIAYPDDSMAHLVLVRALYIPAKKGDEEVIITVAEP